MKKSPDSFPMPDGGGDDGCGDNQEAGNSKPIDDISKIVQERKRGVLETPEPEKHPETLLGDAVEALDEQIEFHTKIRDRAVAIIANLKSQRDDLIARYKVAA